MGVSLPTTLPVFCPPPPRQGAAEGADAPGAPPGRPPPQPPPQGETGAPPEAGGRVPAPPRAPPPRQHLGAHRPRGLTPLTPPAVTGPGPFCIFFISIEISAGGGGGPGAGPVPPPALLHPPPLPRAPFVRGATSPTPQPPRFCISGCPGSVAPGNKQKRRFFFTGVQKAAPGEGGVTGGGDTGGRNVSVGSRFPGELGGCESLLAEVPWGT